MISNWVLLCINQYALVLTAHLYTSDIHSSGSCKYLLGRERKLAPARYIISTRTHDTVLALNLLQYASLMLVCKAFTFTQFTFRRLLQTHLYYIYLARVVLDMNTRSHLINCRTWKQCSHVVHCSPQAKTCTCARVAFVVACEYRWWRALEVPRHQCVLCHRVQKQCVDMFFFFNSLSICCCWSGYSDLRVFAMHYTTELNI